MAGIPASSRNSWRREELNARGGLPEQGLADVSALIAPSSRGVPHDAQSAPSAVGHPLPIWKRQHGRECLPRRGLLGRYLPAISLSKR
jgi:hypothetical protein